MPVFTSTVRSVERLRRVVAQLRLEHREELRARLDQGDARVVGAHVRVVAGEVPAVELGERARRLDAGRAAPDHDDVQGAVRDDARIPVGRLPALEQVILEPDRVREGVHREGVLGRALGAEEVDLGAEAEDEVVVGDRRQLGEADLPRIEVDGGHRVLVDRGVVVALEQVAQRVPDARRLEQARRELVEERLEGVVVVPVDEHDLGVGVLQLLGGAHTGEPAAEDQDAGRVMTARSPRRRSSTRPARGGSTSRRSGRRSAGRSSARPRGCGDSRPAACRR